MKNQQLYTLGALRIISLIGNLYLWDRNKYIPAQPLVSSQVATSTSMTVQSPYGYRSEVVTVLDNGQLKTYATTSAITEKDLEQMQKQTAERMKAMDAYFKQQDEFFPTFWANF